MAVRKIKEEAGVKLGWDAEWQEYQVGPSEEPWGGDRMYHTSEKDDAYDTFQYEVDQATQYEGA